MNKRHTWISDVREGLQQFNKGFFYYYNDANLRQRRIKFLTSDRDTLNAQELIDLQQFIEKRRPELNITVKNWTNNNYEGPWSYNGPQYCVYYKPKVTF